jgi:predicted RNA-binding protein YlxR (DUF448 family)
MIRLSRVNGTLTVSLQGGRGIYVCPDASCLGKAAKLKGVARSLDLEAALQALEDSKGRAPSENALDGAYLVRAISGECSGGGGLG